jgi:hypothetical protein
MWGFIPCWVPKCTWSQRSRMSAGFINVRLEHTWKTVRCWWKEMNHDQPAPLPNHDQPAPLPILADKNIFKKLWSYGMWDILVWKVGKYQCIVGFLTTLFTAEEKIVPWKGKQEVPPKREYSSQKLDGFTFRNLDIQNRANILCHGKTVFSDLLTIKGEKHEVASKRQTLLLQQHNVISRNTYILWNRDVKT